MFELPLAFVYRLGCCNIDGVGTKDTMKFTFKQCIISPGRQAAAGVNNLPRPEVRELYD